MSVFGGFGLVARLIFGFLRLLIQRWTRLARADAAWTRCWLRWGCLGGGIGHNLDNLKDSTSIIGHYS